MITRPDDTADIPGIQMTLERIGLKPGQRVLEIGAGAGHLLIAAARLVLPGGEAVGLDIRPKVVKHLRAQAVKNGFTNLHAMVGDMTQAHFPPGSFDVVYLYATLGQISDPVAALRECYKALRAGGRLSITEMTPDPLFQPREKVRRLVEEAGFRLSALHGGSQAFTANFIK